MNWGKVIEWGLKGGCSGAALRGVFGGYWL
jgi:hypothetical protein